MLHVNGIQRVLFRSIEVGQLDENLIESIYRLCSLVDHPEDIEFLAKPYTKEIYYRLLKGK